MGGCVEVSHPQGELGFSMRRDQTQAAVSHRISCVVGIDPEPLQESLTAWGGVGLAVQAFRSLGLPASIGCHVPIKQRDRGYDEATMVESFVVLNALGGECLEDFTHLREDGGLKEMLRHGIPSPFAMVSNLWELK